MPRASWRGFLRLSLVSCPIYLSPATTRAKSIRLHQVWQPAPVDVAEDAWPDRGEGQLGSAPSAPRLLADDTGPDGDQSPAATRVTLRPHDPATGEEIDKRRVVKGYEYARGEFVTFTAEELKALILAFGFAATWFVTGEKRRDRLCWTLLQLADIRRRDRPVG
jgi:hypothetical protein